MKNSEIAAVIEAVEAKARELRDVPPMWTVVHFTDGGPTGARVHTHEQASQLAAFAAAAGATGITIHAPNGRKRKPLASALLTPEEKKDE